GPFPGGGGGRSPHAPPRAGKAWMTGPFPANIQEFTWNPCATYGHVGYGYVSVQGRRLRAPTPPGENMPRTQDTRDVSTLAISEETALSLDPGAAPLLRKSAPEIDEEP